MVTLADRQRCSGKFAHGTTRQPPCSGAALQGRNNLDVRVPAVAGTLSCPLCLCSPAAQKRGFQVFCQHPREEAQGTGIEYKNCIQEAGVVSEGRHFGAGLPALGVWTARVGQWYTQQDCTPLVAGSLTKRSRHKQAAQVAAAGRCVGRQKCASLWLAELGISKQGQRNLQ